MSKANDNRDLSLVLKGLSEAVISDFPSLIAPVLIGIHTRGVPLALRISRSIEKAFGSKVPVGEIDINLYRDDFSLSAQQPLVKETKVPFEITGKTVILVDDVLYTGRTIRAALDAVMDIGRPDKVLLAVLINRPKDRELPICPNYVGVSIELPRGKRVNVRLKEVDGVDNIAFVKG